LFGRTLWAFLAAFIILFIGDKFLCFSFNYFSRRAPV